MREQETERRELTSPSKGALRWGLLMTGLVAAIQIAASALHIGMVTSSTMVAMITAMAWFLSERNRANRSTSLQPVRVSRPGRMTRL